MKMSNAFMYIGMKLKSRHMNATESQNNGNSAV